MGCVPTTPSSSSWGQLWGDLVFVKRDFGRKTDSTEHPVTCGGSSSPGPGTMRPSSCWGLVQYQMGLAGLSAPSPWKSRVGLAKSLPPTHLAASTLLVFFFDSLS